MAGRTGEARSALSLKGCSFVEGEVSETVRRVWNLVMLGGQYIELAQDSEGGDRMAQEIDR
jgi:hypothetical protein